MQKYSLIGEPNQPKLRKVSVTKVLVIVAEESHAAG